MAETIIRIKKEAVEFQPQQGRQTTSLLSRLNISQPEKETLLTEAAILLSKCNKPELAGSTTGIAIGYVQSGKTMSFTTLTALAVDNGFRVVIYFAGIKLNLLEQTNKRLKKDLLTDSENARAFKVYQSPTIDDAVHSKIKGALGQSHKPAVLITVLKHYKDINELTKIFKTDEVRHALGEGAVLIIDDEADQASLNTYARKNSRAEDWEDDQFSSTYSSILELRSSIRNHSYIQYTATPQAPLLINIMDLLSPKFHIVLTPGSEYTGGRVFFKEMPGLILTIPDSEVYHFKHNNMEACPQSLIDALQLFLINVAIVVNIQGKEPYLSMMVHADREKDASRKFHRWVKDHLDSWQDRLNHLANNDPSRKELVEEFKRIYPEAVRLLDNPPSFEQVMAAVKDVILDYNMELVISKPGKNKKTEIDWSNYSAHILVGAEMLNRGYTIEKLAVSYMPRYSVGKSNADTIQQRCRFFGYKRNFLMSCRVFLPVVSTSEYVEYVEHEEIMRSELKSKTLEEYEQVMVLSNVMNPTRYNVLSSDMVKHKLNGWRQFNALQHLDENIQFIDSFRTEHKFKLFNDYKTDDRNHRYVKIGIKEAITFLRDFKIANMPDSLRKSSTIQYLRYINDNTDVKHAYIFDMAYKVTKGRKRALIDEKNHLKISNIFSGRSSTERQTYPGDKAIMFRDSLCIQIHKIRLEHNSGRWDGKIAYTLGIYYPEDLAHAFVGNPKS
jgi:hypothetical protein